MYDPKELKLGFINMWMNDFVMKKFLWVTEREQKEKHSTMTIASYLPRNLIKYAINTWLYLRLKCLHAKF